jgi:hypothetical protein
MEVSAKSNRYTRIERRMIQGREARVSLLPDEIRIEWRPNRPVYIGVTVGDRIRDGAGDIASAHIDEWEVVEITPESVVGEHVRTGVRREWERKTLERGLVLGNYSTNLTEFDVVAVNAVGSWETYDADAAADAGDLSFHGPPYLMVIAYGDNGQKYSLRYRFVEPGNDVDVELFEEGPRIGKLGPDQRRLLDERVRAALADDGYAVR